MKKRTCALLLLAAAAVSFAAMPTKQELKKVEGLVQELMRPEVDAMKAGKKNRADVAKAALALAEKAESDAAKLLLLKGSFTLYVGHGAFDEAIGVLRTIMSTIPDISPQHVANMVESALRNIPKSKGGQLYRILDDAKAHARHQDELKAALEKSAKRPSLRALHVAIAEHYAYFGDWPKALEEFAKGDNAKAAEVAKAEKGEGKMSQKAIADFWWDYASTEEVQRAFRRHAAEVYAAAIASGGISGLETVLAQRRINEAKEYGEDLLAPVEKKAAPSGGKAPVAVSGKQSNALYCIVDLSAGPNASKYPVSYLAAEPKGGFNTDEYKTTKLVLRRIESGKFMMGAKYEVTLTKPFYCGIFEVTQKQYELVTGNNPSKYKGDMRPVEKVSWNAIRGDSSTYNWPSSANVDPSTFMGKIQARTGLTFDLPTEAQWEYACRAGTTSSFNNGGESETDLKKLGRFVLNQKTRGWKESDTDLARHEPDGKGGYSEQHTVVGSYIPNAWGLYDMHGNVFEWCLDWLGHLSGDVTDPHGSSSGSRRVARGGSWNIFADCCTSSCRIFDYPSSVIYSHGFRLCMNPDGPVGASARGSGTPAASATQPANGLYCVIDLSAGPTASKYPVSYLAVEPKGGWTDEHKTTKLVLRRIEPGKFMMGGKYEVTLTKPFYCGVFEVTQKQYELVTGSNPSQYKGDMRPVEKVSYDMIRGKNAGAKWPASSAVDLSSFIGKIRERTGIEGFDLPTEAQWEYACRAGTTSKYNNGGDAEADLRKLGRILFNQAGRAWKEPDASFAKHEPDGKGGCSECHTVVGSYLPNAWGLYDMHGNVWERCLDWRGDLSSGMTEPVGSSSGSRRVLRGGSWTSGADGCASSFRSFNYPSGGGNDGGFRLCMNPDSPVGSTSPR